jgi:hypothetical protein
MSTTWYSKDMGDGVESYAPSQRLFDAFTAFAAAGNIPRGIGVFSNYDLRRNVVTWYFSPETEALAKAFGASPCPKPTPVRGFGLLVGSAFSWEVHFPGYVGGAGT